MTNSVKCNELMQQVYEAGFAAYDAALFLDTHPDDLEALNYFYCALSLSQQAVQAYEEQCGPLSIGGVMDENYWSWLSDPWPWEGACG